MTLARFTALTMALVWLAGMASAADNAVVVVANKSAPVNTLSTGQTTQIFLRQVQTWPDGTPIMPVDIKEGSPMRTEFYARVTGRSPGQLRAYWARLAFTGMGVPPRQADSAEDAARIVLSTPGAIGYVGKQRAEPPLKMVLEPEP